MTSIDGSQTPASPPAFDTAPRLDDVAYGRPAQSVDAPPAHAAPNEVDDYGPSEAQLKLFDVPEDFPVVDKRRIRDATITVRENGALRSEELLYDNGESIVTTTRTIRARDTSSFFGSSKNRTFERTVEYFGEDRAQRGQTYEPLVVSTESTFLRIGGFGFGQRDEVSAGVIARADGGVEVSFEGSATWGAFIDGPKKRHSFLGKASSGIGGALRSEEYGHRGDAESALSLPWLPLSGSGQRTGLDEKTEVGVGFRFGSLGVTSHRETKLDVLPRVPFDDDAADASEPQAAVYDHDAAMNRLEELERRLDALPLPREQPPPPTTPMELERWGFDEE